MVLAFLKIENQLRNSRDDRIIHNLLYNSKSNHEPGSVVCIFIECIGENCATRAWRRPRTARSTGRTGALCLGVPLPNSPSARGKSYNNLRFAPKARKKMGMACTSKRPCTSKLAHEFRFSPSSGATEHISECERP